MPQHKSPLVSIIVPCYNQGQYLGEALDSVLAQTYSNWEVIIVDDGSTDNSAEVAKAYIAKDSRIHYFHQTNAGPSAARNYGVRESKGKYIQFLDGDDKLSARCIELAVKHMESHQETVVFYSRVRYFGVRNDEFVIRWTGYADLLCANSIICCCMMRRTDFNRIGGFDEQMHGYEDWELFIRLLYGRPEVYQHPDFLFHYRITDSQTSVNAQAGKRAAELCNYTYEKNKEKYAATLGSPITAYKECRRCKKELDAILASKTYKAGRLTLAPLRWMKKLLCAKQEQAL